MQQKKAKEQREKQQKKGEDKKKDTDIEYNYDECDFPLPYSEKRLIEGWYDFNDSSVTPILPGKLQSQFGNGSGGENAYILIYRQKKMCQDIAKEKSKPTYPDYWKTYVSELNAVNKTLRENHSSLENQIDVIIQDESLFSIDPESFFVSYLEDSKIEEQGFKLRLFLPDPLISLKGKLAEFMGDT
jgi:hypothetical protein